MERFMLGHRQKVLTCRLVKKVQMQGALKG